MIREQIVVPFLDRCEAYRDAAGISRARLSTLIFNSGVTLDRLREGANVTIDVLQRASDQLAELEAGPERVAA